MWNAQDGWKTSKNGAGKELVLGCVPHQSKLFVGRETDLEVGGAPRRAMRDINSRV